MADSSENVRRGVLGAIYEYKNRNIVGGEILIIAIVCGVYFASWWVFGGIFAGCVKAGNILQVDRQELVLIRDQQFILVFRAML